MEGRKMIMVYILIGIYILCSALGLVLMKYGINKNFSLNVNMKAIHFEISVISLFGIILYIISFLLSLIIMSKSDIMFFYPISAGMIYVLICVIGVVFLHEAVSIKQWIGIALILSGVVFINIGR